MWKAIKDIVCAAVIVAAVAIAVVVVGVRLIYEIAREQFRVIHERR